MDIVAVEYNTTIKKLLSIIVESAYSRIPVYKETLDNIKGVLYTKDLLPYLHETKSFKWQSLIKQAFFVPETKKIDDLLAEFQKNKIHLAIVIDEYGGTSGLITMEDILEEVIGEISDESDVDEELLYKKISNNIYLFEAKILLNDFYKITGIEDTTFDDIKGEYETLAGLLLELKGEIPLKNDRIEYKNFSFLIEAVDKRRIKQVKVIIK
jgi:CBS domain containing-hemolysin-like protein